MKKIIIASAAIAVLAASCSSDPSWKVKGTVDGAEGKLVVLEASNNGFWYPLDTMTAKSKGAFSFEQPAAGYPDIYRLTIDGRSLYFPVDSIETVSVAANVADFGSVAEISGSPSAEAIVRVDRLIADAVKAKGNEAVNDPALKRSLSEIILEDPSGIAAYYIINKRIGNTQLFNAAVKSDLRMIGAVANSFTVSRPADPRTAYLKSLYLSNRPSITVPSDTLVASELNFIDIDLLNPEGKSVKLSDLVGNGKVTVLNFTSLSDQNGPAFNLQLGKIYEQLKGDGLQIYQVGVDADEFAWRKAAKNLPWTSVYCGQGNAEPLIRYNVGSIPAVFILDRNGALVERVTDMSALSSSVKKYL